ncbi:DUF4336 domain-containing protein [Agarivorans sp. MS3-6]|uniref:DUF4336 domain-containing protein n=1 Tax=Agarivorans sp. TSD2052 TaxID=2937286 RepID=UPI00200D593F|nr:DUF4336 domain-containing protein [Agarivorans sp. TSD2052]UPW17012.1 DUF4336 domain-containing protein [Agarivorans sp. TSD2052]
MDCLADKVWIFNGKAVPFLGLPYTTRMTVIRLANGDLWVHSPIELTEDVQTQVEQLGRVSHLIAPNHLHHLFLADWQAAYPNAKSYGTPELIKKRSDLVFDASFNEQPLWPWSEELDQVLFTGSPFMEECVFFHRASGALIVTDLIENFSGDNFSYWQRVLAKATGILAPNGKMPIDWRLSFMFGKTTARKHLSVIFGWKPTVIVMAHGVIVDREAMTFLTRSFSWLI